MFLSNSADSVYHSLQTTLRKRFSNGLLFNFAYTLSKVIDDQSGDRIAMAAKKFGERMHHEIGAQRERPGGDGRGEGGIDDDIAYASVMGERGKLPYVGELQGRIAGRL